jgi:hypothetical protein
VPVADSTSVGPPAARAAVLIAEARVSCVSVCSRTGRPSAEVSRGVRDTQVEDVEVVGEEAGDVAVAAFEDAADEECGCVADDGVVAAPHR